MQVTPIIGICYAILGHMYSPVPCHSVGHEDPLMGHTCPTAGSRLVGHADPTAGSQVAQ